MKKLLVKIICMVILCVTFTTAITVTCATELTVIEPRFTGIDAMAASLSINDNGRALCGCSVLADTGYSVNVTMELECDGTEIKTWTGSGSRVDLAEPYYVTKNHDYQVVVTARVNTSGGLYLYTYTEQSSVKSY